MNQRVYSKGKGSHEPLPFFMSVDPKFIKEEDKMDKILLIIVLVSLIVTKLYWHFG